jgi:hypothetical protein
MDHPIAELKRRSAQHRHQINRLIVRHQDCPRPISYRVDWHLHRSESLEAAYQQFQLDWWWD